MTFHDLPDGWQDQPLTDSTLVADALDLCISDASRTAGAIYLLLCDAQDRLVQPCSITQMPTDFSKMRREQYVEPFAALLGDVEPDGALLLALARPDGLSITDSDKLWQLAAAHVCQREGVRLLGVHIVTLHGSRELPRFGRAA